RRTGLPIQELIRGRVVRRNSSGHERFSDYFSDKGTSTLCVENVRNISSIPSPVRTNVQRYLSSLPHASPTEVTGEERLGSVESPRVNPTEPASKRVHRTTVRRRLSEMLKRGAVLATSAADSNVKKATSVASTSLSSIVRRVEKVTSAAKAATSFANDSRHVSFEENAGVCYGVKAMTGEHWNKQENSAGQRMKEKPTARESRGNNTSFVPKVKVGLPSLPEASAKRTSTFFARTEKQTGVCLESLSSSSAHVPMRCKSSFFAPAKKQDGGPLENLPPSSPQMSTRGKNNFFARAKKQDGGPLERSPRSSLQTLSKVPSSLVSVRKELQAKHKPERTLALPVPSVGSSPPGDPGHGWTGPKCNDRETKNAQAPISSTEEGAGCRSELAAPQQSTALPYRFFKSRQSNPLPLLSRDMRDVAPMLASLPKGPKIMDVMEARMTKRKMVATATVHPVKQSRGDATVPSSDVVVPSAKSHSPGLPERVVASQ
ncbi:unnamed protein product, partial [Ixodes hexagonus]